MVVFCAIEDETNDYLKREFASMKDFVRLLINRALALMLDNL